MLRSAINTLRANLAIKRDPVAYARSLGVKIGNNVRLVGIRPGYGTFGSEPYLVSIGDHVTVTGAVQFITHDGGVWVFREEEPNIDVFGPIKIESNVFIGYAAILMPGVVIGENSVVGAGSIVTRDVPPDTVVVGAPAKVLYTREEYYEKIGKNKEYIRHLSQKQKRKYLLDKYKC